MGSSGKLEKFIYPVDRVSGLHTMYPYIFFHCIRYFKDAALCVIVFYRKLADGMFLNTCEEVSKLYPKIQFQGMIVDNACMQVCYQW